MIDKSAYYAEKNRRFSEQVASGEWPQDTCDSCARLGCCCQRYHHHHGDSCLHCGNDERNPRTWGYRGKHTR